MQRVVNSDISYCARPLLSEFQTHQNNEVRNDLDSREPALLWRAHLPWILPANWETLDGCMVTPSPSSLRGIIPPPAHANPGYSAEADVPSNSHRSWIKPVRSVTHYFCTVVRCLYKTPDRQAVRLPPNAEPGAASARVIDLWPALPKLQISRLLIGAPISSCDEWLACCRPQQEFICDRRALMRLPRSLHSAWLPDRGRCLGLPG